MCCCCGLAALTAFLGDEDDETEKAGKKKIKDGSRRTKIRRQCIAITTGRGETVTFSKSF
ncbi:Uncharacterized protein APZ42_011296 [Daphnia magna]|uniref:Uncharacterized protein n=1 Tax=Daphnia magna TaxID=35525 RepID=A0A162CYW6_9CRUS|nr:Uncharacterized protein APZ42_011296 [Daphnia magna]